MNEPLTNGGNGVRDEFGRFVEGHPGGPGRPKGSRHRLEEAFLRTLADSFVANGAETIEYLRVNDPSTYNRIIASLVTKQANVDVTHHEGEGLNEAQARNMAQEFLERAARTESVG